MEKAKTLSVLFVCLGNICRSPSAEGVLRARLAKAGLSDRVRIDSAGTGDWHVGKPPDARAAAAAAARGAPIDDLCARQLQPDDLQQFDYVLAMDTANLAALEELAQITDRVVARISLFGDYSARYRGQPVPDPYFGGDEGFEHVLDQIEDACEGLIRAIRDRLGTYS